ncbi:MAG: cyclic-phosphate processing receiver domain-containing protein [Candidatus Omnitrophota bacterium]
MPDKLKIWLDDERDPKDWERPGWTWVKTATECIELLKKGNVEEISFDHDLGEFNGKNEKTGYDVIKWIEEEVFTNKDYLPPREMDAHSANFGGHKDIELVIEHIDRMMVERWGDICKKLKIWLDDKRDPEEWNHPGWIWVKTANECIELLKTGEVEAISLDHDLGEINGKQEKTGYDVIRWIEDQVGEDTGFLPPRIMKPHSNSYIGHEKIKVAIKHTEDMMAEKLGEDWRNRWDNKG